MTKDEAWFVDGIRVLGFGAKPERVKVGSVEYLVAPLPEESGVGVIIFAEDRCVAFPVPGKVLDLMSAVGSDSAPTVKAKLAPKAFADRSRPPRLTDLEMLSAPMPK